MGDINEDNKTIVVTSTGETGYVDLTQGIQQGD